MLQGPIGLAPVTGRICTRISYSSRTTIHDTLLPTSAPSTPQVVYTPQESDLPVISGHHINMPEDEEYKVRWQNVKMLCFKNYSSSYRVVTIGYRTEGTTYGTFGVYVYGNMNFSVLTSSGLNNPGIGLEEDIRLHCATQQNDIKLYKSCFAVVPYQLDKGPLGYREKITLMSSTASLFGEPTIPGYGMYYCVIGGMSMPVSSDNQTIPFAYMPTSDYYAINLSQVFFDQWQTTLGTDFTHMQFRYPTAIIYNKSIG